MTDKEMIERVQRLAQDSKEQVKCACVIVKDGEVLAEEHNSQHVDNMAVNHAEIKALVSANYRSGSRILAHAIVYCSCEPCAMCLAALSYAKVERIVYAKSMKEMSPDDKQGNFDSQAFIKTLNYQPTLE
ncbi:MAG: tRNA-specific adenosine deaminase, partial [Candidatus Saccharibacteria bacterium]|nr:tRNA-specific adenosine deaminase [Candidatus Saccharibacteria bacterium]